MVKRSAHVSAEAISRFRLRRHHLLSEPPVDAVTICRDVCGVQAQVMSSAFLQLWARNHALTRAEIEAALWQRRTLIKTSLMRQTLHLIPSEEFPLYIAAVKASRVAAALRIMARFGIVREEADALSGLIVESLSPGPLGRAAITAAVRPKVSKRVRAWMDKVFSIVRLPVFEGLVCYGRGESNEVSYIRVDRWLPHLKAPLLSETEAQCVLFRKYLRAYGPASAADFSHWSGIPMHQVKPLLPILAPELEEISGNKKLSFLLREDLTVLKRKSAPAPPIRLLPSFDTYLLAHRTKDHLLSAKHYKRVYRNQGWISPVVLLDGGIAGVWRHATQKKTLQVEIEPFGKFSRAVRAAIQREAQPLADYFSRTLQLEFV